MKKITAWLLAVFLIMITLSSCGGISCAKQNKWYSRDTLEECLVPNLPELNKTYLRQGDDVYVRFSQTEYASYANTVYTYLLSQNFEYLGTRGEEKNSLAGAFTTYYFQPATKLSEFEVSGYIFVYSNGEIVDGDGELTFCILKIMLLSDEYNKEYGNKDFKYNAIISLRFHSETPLGGSYELKDEADGE